MCKWGSGWSLWWRVNMEEREGEDGCVNVCKWGLVFRWCFYLHVLFMLGVQGVCVCVRECVSACSRWAECLLNWYSQYSQFIPGFFLLLVWFQSLAEIWQKHVLFSFFQSSSLKQQKTLFKHYLPFNCFPVYCLICGSVCLELFLPWNWTLVFMSSLERQSPKKDSEPVYWFPFSEWSSRCQINNLREWMGPGGCGLRFWSPYH